MEVEDIDKAEITMSVLESKSISSVPKWDRKAASCGRYISKLTVLAVYYNCGNAMDKKKMEDCPTLTEYEALDSSKPDDKKKEELFNANRRMCAIMVLGQDSDHGLAVIEKTKTDDHPHGLAYKAVATLKAKYKPKDSSAKIEMTAELEKIQFRTALNYYNDAVAVIAWYSVKCLERISSR